jgi:O-succinylhomoserine sulfhydrylase
VTFVDGTDLDQWRAAVTPGTKAVFFESMSNPTLELVDIAAVSEIAHAVGALVVVDNVFATPIFSRAVEQGADVVVYSTTKHIDGQGRALGGVVCGTARLHPQGAGTLHEAHRRLDEPLHRLDHAERHGTLDLRCRAMAEGARADGRRRWKGTRGCRA